VVAETNNDPKPFVWNADPKKIIAAVTRGYLYRGLASLAPAMGPWQIHGMAIRENQRANYEQSLELRRGDAHGKLMILRRPTLQWDADGSGPRSSGKRYEVVFPDISEWN